MIVITISTAAHGCGESVVLAPAYKVIAAELTALIRMDDHRIFGCHRLTAINNTSRVSSVTIVGFIDQPMTIRE